MSDTTDQLLTSIKKINPLQTNFLDQAVLQISKEDMTDFEKYLLFCQQSGITLDYLADAYDLIVKDTLREQIYFKRNGCYRYSTYNEVAGSVYLNDDYMSRYMYGLALTSYLWPNHASMRKYYEKMMNRNNTGNYLEIGPGHGIYFIKSMKNCSYSFYEGIDISPTSVSMSNKILASGYFGHFENYSVRECDFLEMQPSKLYNCVVMGEVLEHVEQPLVFLNKIKALSTSDAFIYITTCINAPAIDHISLFTSVAHLDEIILESGLKIIDKHVVPYTGLSTEECLAKKLPINIAYVLGNN